MQSRYSTYTLPVGSAETIDVGTLNPAIAILNPPPIPEVQKAAACYSGQYGPIIDMSQAVPGYPPPSQIMDALVSAASDTRLLGYGPLEGEHAFRTVYAQWLSERYHVPIDPSQTLVTSGCNQAFVSVALAIAQHGSAMLMPSPYYFNHQTTLAMLGIEVRTCPTLIENAFLPEVTALEKALTGEIIALALVSPNNPTGAIYPAELLADIYQLCKAKNIWLILDETYRDFCPPGSDVPHSLFQEPDWPEHFISLYSFSKSCCIPGHRLGAVTCSASLVQQLGKVIDNVQICAPRVPQAALASSLLTPEVRSWMAANTLEMNLRLIAVRAVFQRLAKLDGLSTDRDEQDGTANARWRLCQSGAYFSYVRHPFGDEDASSVAQRLAAVFGIITLPGNCFGDDQADYLRIAFANVDVQGIQALEERLKLAQHDQQNDRARSDQTGRQR